MSIDYRRLRESLQKLLEAHGIDELKRRLASKPGDLPPRPTARPLSPQTLEQRWRVIGNDPAIRDQLLDPQTLANLEHYKRNVENFIGTVKVPVGVAGPPRVYVAFPVTAVVRPLGTVIIIACVRGMSVMSPWPIR
jgi:hydroxymethylglutaryl-CoA reductase (NADPH)